VTQARRGEFREPSGRRDVSNGTARSSTLEEQHTMTDRTRLAAPGSPAQLDALVREPEHQPGSAWIENGDEAALVAANVLGALDQEPAAMEVALPDGRRIVAAAAAVSIRFQRSHEGWDPILIQGIRVRSVWLDDQVLYHARDLTDETVHFLPAW
jgi:hypothetical protein